MTEEPPRLPGECLDDEGHAWIVWPRRTASGQKVEDCAKCRINRKLYEEWRAEVEGIILDDA